jgi:hypothetical protein
LATFPEGRRIHYNVVKPHMALDGQTPAQAAGAGFSTKNRLMELLKNALVDKTTTSCKTQSLP